MNVITDIEQFKPVRKPFVTIGTFDGVHFGHRVILKKIREEAKAEKGTSVLLTFYPHPRTVLFPDDNSLKLLNTQNEKIELLDEFGIENLIILPFTLEFSRLNAFDFVRDVLVNKIGVYKLIIGYDHQFGRNREGNYKQLEEYAALFDFEIEEIPAQEIDDIKISSTKIRKALFEGDLQKAEEYLGYPYSLSGMVIEGDKLGRSIGFPTANLKVYDKHKLIPANGVYAVLVKYNDKRFKGMMNIGRRPTVNNTDLGLAMEVHLFNFNEDIYHKEITVLLRKRIRDEIKFDNLTALKKQLEKDKVKIERYFKESKNASENPFT